MQAHIKIEQHPNPYRRTYHVTSEVLTEVRYGFGEDSYFGSMEKKTNEDILGLVAKLKAIPGIVGGIVKNYEIHLAIGEAFEWVDVGPLALGEIVKALFPEVLGSSIMISNQMVESYCVPPQGFDDDGTRYRYFYPMKRELVPVDFKGGRPILDVESFFDLEKAKKEKNEKEET